MTKDSGHPSCAGGMKKPWVTMAEAVVAVGYQTCLMVKQLAAEWQTWAERVGALRHGQP